MFSTGGKLSLVIIVLYISVAILAPQLSPYSHNSASGSPLLAPCAEHMMGTDELGYDLWAQIAHGARVSITIGLSAAVLAILIGGVIGIIAGYAGGYVDKLLMRLVDIMISIPELPLIILLAAFLGPSLVNIVIVLVVFSWTQPARLVRSQIIVLKGMEYVQSAETYGAGLFYLIKVHFIRELFPLLAISLVKQISRAITAEAGLSFLGLGDPTSKSWGFILNHALAFNGIFHSDFWKWWIVFPWLAILLLIVSLALVGRDLEKICDPKV